MSGPSRDFTPAAGFHFRTPQLSFDAFLAWGADLRAAREQGDGLAAALTTDRETQRQRLRNLIAAPELRDAIFVASPDLDEAIEIWLAGKRAEYWRVPLPAACRRRGRGIVPGPVDGPQPGGQKHYRSVTALL